MLGEDGEKAFYGTEQRPVDHVGTVASVVGAHVLHLEALREHVINLDRRHLPLAPDGVAHVDVDLRRIKCSPALRNGVLQASGVERGSQCVGRMVPLLYRAEVLLRPSGQFRLELGQPETPQKSEHEGQQARQFCRQLFACAEDVRVVLSEAAEAQKPVQYSRALKTVNGAELKEPQWELPV